MPLQSEECLRQAACRADLLAAAAAASALAAEPSCRVCDGGCTAWPLQATHIFDGLERWPTHFAYLEGGRMLKGAGGQPQAAHGPSAAASCSGLLFQRHSDDGWERSGGVCNTRGGHALAAGRTNRLFCAPAQADQLAGSRSCKRAASCCMWWKAGCARRKRTGCGGAQRRRPLRRRPPSRVRRSCPASTWRSSAEGCPGVAGVRCNPPSAAAGHLSVFWPLNGQRRPADIPFRLFTCGRRPPPVLGRAEGTTVPVGSPIPWSSASERVLPMHPTR